MYRIELWLKPCFVCTSTFSLIALGKWIFTFYLHIFRMLFIWFFPCMHWVFPFSLTGAFPLLADMKTNVCACVCVCWGKTGPAERVNGKAIGGIFQEGGETGERGGKKGFRLVPHVKCKCNFQFRRVCENQQMKGKRCRYWFLLFSLFYLLYSFYMVEYSTRELRLRLVEDGPQRSPRHAFQVLLRNRNDNKSPV